MSDSETNDFVQVALPFQVPEPPDLSKIPLSVIHSATVETLISQTEDLSARLKVQIRRNAVMERRALELEESAKFQDKQLSSLQQQHELLMEKDAGHLDKIRTLEQTSADQKNEIELLEVRYAEQSQLHRKEISEQSTKVAQLEQQVTDLSRLLPLEKENFKLADDNAFLKTEVEELASHLQTKESEVRSLREHIIKMEAVIHEKTDEVNTLKSQMENVTHELRQKVESVTQELRQQTETFHMELRKQTDISNRAIEEKSELENLVILKEREKEHERSSVAAELMTARQELKNTQVAFRSVQSEKVQLETQLKSTEETINGLSRDNNDLEKQIQNLQGLWYKLQSEFEKERTKTTALTKLNRELSVELQRTKTSPQYDEDFFKRYVNNNRNMDV